MPARSHGLGVPGGPFPASLTYAFVMSLAVATATACRPPTPLPAPSQFSPRLVIDAPSSDPTSLTVTFEWHLVDADPAGTYHFEVRLDKGVNACDTGKSEDVFDAGTSTQLAVSLDPVRYRGQSVDFGIRADDGRGFSICQQGRRFSLP
jgi:hypothetical protein